MLAFYQFYTQFECIFALSYHFFSQLTADFILAMISDSFLKSFFLHFQALDGFIAVITQDGQLFYVSENVRDFLGYSQVSHIVY